MIDPNEGMKGFTAIKKIATEHWEFSCTGCDLLDDPDCLDAHCTPGERIDGCSVILKRNGPVMATASFPCDDMGAPV